MRTAVYSTLALIAFASNSVLCRLALQRATVDPATFTTIRMISGAAMLLLVMAWTGRDALQKRTGSWAIAGILSLYAVPFSFAYTGLTAGTGALILFGSVQVTMLIAAVRSGERPHWGEWIGLIVALAGLVYLVLPGLSAPPLTAAAPMGIAGCCWGIYSLQGRRAANPLAQTTSNFVRSVPMVLVASLVMRERFHAELRGTLLALASGALTSGLGYVAWYTALRGMTAVRAAVLQLAVPILAAVGGVVLLAESISTRLVLSTIMVLGGIALAIVSHENLSRRSQTVTVRVAASRTTRSTSEPQP
jgi:drug/metabolite transporter (DMT)-like permease